MRDANRPLPPLQNGLPFYLNFVQKKINSCNAFGGRAIIHCRVLQNNVYILQLLTNINVKYYSSNEERFFKWIFQVISKAFFFVFILCVRRSIDVLDLENQPGSGSSKIQTRFESKAFWGFQRRLTPKV